jgi:hypothetical protein
MTLWKQCRSGQVCSSRLFIPLEDQWLAITAAMLSAKFLRSKRVDRGGESVQRLIAFLPQVYAVV